MNIWDWTARAWSIEYGPSIHDWAQAEASLGQLRWWAQQAFHRVMLVEDPTSKVGVAMFVRSDGVRKVVFAFTAPKWPGRSAQSARERRVAYCMRFCDRIEIRRPRLQNTSNSVPGSCIEIVTFRGALNKLGDRNQTRGVMRTKVVNLAPGSAWSSPMCANCRAFAAVLSEGCPRFEIRDMS